MSRGNLNPRDSECIQKNYSYLKSELEPFDIFDYLFEKNVISSDHREEINRAKNKTERNEIMLQALLHAGPGEAFNHFLQSLEPDYKHVLEKLGQTVKVIDEMKIKDDKIVQLQEEQAQLNLALMDLQKRLTEKTQEKDKLIKRVKTEASQLERLKKEVQYMRPIVMSIKKMEINVALLGITGAGKSSVGNSILRREAFAATPYACTETKVLQLETAEVNGRTIRVFDLPSLIDTEMTTEESRTSFVKAMTEAFTLNPHGFHAFLYVHNLEPRFSSEDRFVIESLKYIMGQDVFKDFGVMIFTHLDKMNIDYKIIIQGSKKALGDLVLKCDNRVVIFDNVTKDKAIQDKQVNHLIAVIDNLIFHRAQRFTEMKLNQEIK